MRQMVHVACMGEKRNACSVVVDKPEGNRYLARSRCRWEDNIKMTVRELDRRM
jgi:hypothetical protein